MLTEKMHADDLEDGFEETLAATRSLIGELVDSALEVCSSGSNEGRPFARLFPSLPGMLALS